MSSTTPRFSSTLVVTPPTSPGARAAVAATKEAAVASILEEAVEMADKTAEAVKAVEVAAVHQLKAVAMVDKARPAVRIL
jgi:hypothetical protein